MTVALTLGAATSGVAQTDTSRARQDTSRSMQDSTRRSTMQDSTRTRRRNARRARTSSGDVSGVTSSRRIPLRKDMSSTSSMSTTTSTDSSQMMVSGGEVMLTQRYDSMFTSERSRVDSMFANDRSRIDDLNNKVNGVNDAVAGVRRDVDALRTSQMATADSLRMLRTAFDMRRNRSLFGNSGFFVGLATGANFPNGTLNDIGYDPGLNVEVPIGWRKPGSLLGVQLNLGVQTFDGLNNRAITGTNGSSFNFYNPDPQVYSAVGALTLNFPLGQNRHNSFYLIGGGGLYHFRHVGTSSTLAAQLGDDVVESGQQTVQTGEENINKWGVTGGAGLQFGLIGPSSIFVESRFTNVFSNRNDNTSIVLGDNGKNLRWVPVMVGISLH
jgi:hypothetical protein